jgi:DNA polymerase-3 subunit delta
MGRTQEDTCESILDRMKGGAMLPLIWLYGEDEGRARSLLEELRSVLIPEASLAFNQIRLDGREVSLDRVLEMARSVPMLSKHRLVVVHNASEFKNSDLDRAVAYFRAPCPSTCLVFWGQKPPQSEEVGRLILEKGAMVQLRARSEAAAQAWVRERVRREGKTITREAAHALIERVGTHQAALEGEVQKLVVFVGERGLIQESDVQDVAAEIRYHTLFELTDALADNRPADALRILHQSLGSGTPPLVVVGMLARQLRLLCAAMPRGGQAPPAKGEAKVPRFVWERLLKQAREWSEEKLFLALKGLLEVDEAMKGGRLDPEVLLDRWALKVALTQVAPSHGRAQIRDRR